MEQQIKHKAGQLGFDVVGITDASPMSPEHIAYLKHWLETGCAGDMAYMKNNFAKRINPALLLEGAKSIICVGLSYHVAQPSSAVSLNSGRIADYACFEDYHDFIKQRLFALADFLKSIAGQNLKFKACIDSVPIAERYFAQRAGLGFIARNHMLTNPVLGQEILLGELITDLELKPDKPLVKDKCDDCDKCIKACPTGALKADGLDARKCISYLTIEHKSEIPEELKATIGNRFFGCDECVNACPYNNITTEHTERMETNVYKFRKELQQIDLQKIMQMDEPEFKKHFSGTPILRLGLQRAKRNAAVCRNNYPG